MTDSTTWGQHRKSTLDAPPYHYSPRQRASSPPLSQQLKSSAHGEGSFPGYTKDAFSPSQARAQQLPPVVPPPTFSPTYYPSAKVQMNSPGSTTRPVHAQPDMAIIKQKSPTGRSDTAFVSQVQVGNRRTFRQRRKDPSCDSCRERKVKCDATDNMSCSECNQRGVKCQFTKDTNRRMTSTKQLSDLEKQVTSLKRENERLRALRDQSDAMELDNLYPASKKESFSDSSTVTHQYGKVEEFELIHKKLAGFSQGVFDIAIPDRPAAEKDESNQGVEIESHLLPPASICSHLLNLCRKCPHPCLSSISWQIYIDDVGKFRNVGQFTARTTADAAIFLALIAFGILLDPALPHQTETRQFRHEDCIQKAIHYCVYREEKSTASLCLAALVISAYWLETGSRSSAWAWLGISVTVASNAGILGCGISFLPQSLLVRRNIWKSVILWDRLLCLELSKSALVDATDFSTTLDQVLRAENSDSPVNAPVDYDSESYRWLALLLPYTQVMVSLQQTLRLSPIPPDVFASQLQAINRVSKLLKSKDPRHLAFSTLPWSLQIILSRHNFNPLHPVEVRREALESCYDAAKKTAQFIESSVEAFREATSAAAEEKLPSTWKDILCSSTTSLLCTHVWRCTVVLCASLDFDSAIALAKIGSAIGNSRRTNKACSWSILSFLEQLAARIASGKATVENFLIDPEILAYISTDSQGDPRSAWVWDGRAGFVPFLNREEHQQPYPSFLPTAAAGGDQHRTSGAGLAKEHAWDRVADVLVHLKGQTTQQQRLSFAKDPANSSASDSRRVSGGSEARREKLPSPTGAGASEMMNIKNLI